MQKRAHWTKSGGKFRKMEGTNKLYEIEGKMQRLCENRGKLQTKSRWLKNVTRNFGGWNIHFLGKVGQIFRDSSEIFWKEGEIRNRGKCIIGFGGMDAPAHSLVSVKKVQESENAGQSSPLVKSSSVSSVHHWGYDMYHNYYNSANNK